MKLFEIEYSSGGDNGTYFTVGNDKDNNKTIAEREKKTERWINDSQLYYIGAVEIDKIDGYQILVEDKEIPEKISDYTRNSGRINNSNAWKYIYRYLLPKGWYCVEPIDHEAINLEILNALLFKYSDKYRKEYRISKRRRNMSRINIYPVLWKNKKYTVSIINDDNDNNQYISLFTISIYKNKKRFFSKSIHEYQFFDAKESPNYVNLVKIAFKSYENKLFEKNKDKLYFDLYAKIEDEYTGEIPEFIYKRSNKSYDRR